MQEHKELEKFVKQITQTLNQKFELKPLTFFVNSINGINDNFPILNNFKFTCGIEVEALYKEQLIDFLTKLIGKKIQTEKEFIIWGEMPINFVSKKDKTPEINDKQIIKTLKTRTILPDWLDRFIFDKLHAKYEPDHAKFSYNLELKDDDLKRYLGTYFPRSYSEAFLIFSNIFSNIEIKTLFKKEEINILDFGSGSGGNLIGLLFAIEKFLPKKTKVNIYSVDGNENSLEIQKQIVSKFISETARNVNFDLLHFKVTDVKKLKFFFKEKLNRKVDIVMSFKFLSELFNKDKQEFHNIYYDFANTVIPFIAKNAIVVILDVTTKLSNEKYLPIELNAQINRFDKMQDSLKTVIPISCSLHSAKCTHDCFTQQPFLVSHSHKNKDLSKVTYRILGTYSIYNLLKGKTVEDCSYVIHWNISVNIQKEKHQICNIKVHTNYKDGFLLT